MNDESKSKSKAEKDLETSLLLLLQRNIFQAKKKDRLFPKEIFLEIRSLRYKTPVEIL